MATYIVIELSENENALEIMNVLMTQTKARFTITKEIGEYAAEREQLKRVKEQENDKCLKPSTPDEPSEPPKKKSCPEESKKETEMDFLSQIVSSPDFANLIPKEEEQEITIESLLGSRNEINNQTQIDPIQYSSIAEIINSASTSSQVNTEGKKSRKRENEAFQCHLCGTMIKAYNFDYYKRSNHAIIHTNLQRYICPVKSCGTKTRHRSNMVVHARTSHGFKGKVDVQNCLLPHEDEELKQTVINCFPEMAATVQSMTEREKKKNPNGFEEETGIESDEELFE